MHRLVMQPLTLSNGLVIPKGTHICFPAGPMSRDPSLVANPAAFDGFRWCKDPTDRNALVETNSDVALNDTNDEKSQRPPLGSTTSTSYVSLGPTIMHFGYGRQACPGRFFAGCMIKLIMSRILMEYDFKYDNDRTGWRPDNVHVGEHILPSTHTTVLLRKRNLEF